MMILVSKLTCSLLLCGKFARLSLWLQMWFFLVKNYVSGKRTGYRSTRYVLIRCLYSKRGCLSASTNERGVREGRGNFPPIGTSRIIRGWNVFQTLLPGNELLSFTVMDIRLHTATYLINPIKMRSLWKGKTYPWNAASFLSFWHNWKGE